MVDLVDNKLKELKWFFLSLFLAFMLVLILVFVFHLEPRNYIMPENWNGTLPFTKIVNCFFLC
jgi:hypothetical protein